MREFCCNTRKGEILICHEMFDRYKYIQWWNYKALPMHRLLCISGHCHRGIQRSGCWTIAKRRAIFATWQNITLHHSMPRWYFYFGCCMWKEKKVFFPRIGMISLDHGTRRTKKNPSQVKTLDGGKKKKKKFCKGEEKKKSNEREKNVCKF